MLGGNSPANVPKPLSTIGEVIKKITACFFSPLGFRHRPGIRVKKRHYDGIAHQPRVERLEVVGADGPEEQARALKMSYVGHNSMFGSRLTPELTCERVKQNATEASFRRSPDTFSARYTARSYQLCDTGTVPADECRSSRTESGMGMVAFSHAALHRSSSASGSAPREP